MVLLAASKMNLVLLTASNPLLEQHSASMNRARWRCPVRTTRPCESGRPLRCANFTRSAPLWIATVNAFGAEQAPLFPARASFPKSWLNTKQHSPHTHDCPQIDTGHTRNIFCCKFVPRDGDARVVSCGADGMVRAPRLFRRVLRGPLQNVCAQCSFCRAGWWWPQVLLNHVEGGAARGKLLHQCAAMALKIVFLPSDPNCFICTCQV